MAVLLDEVDLNKALAKVEAHMAEQDSPSFEDFEALQDAIQARDGKISQHVQTLYAQLDQTRRALASMHTSRIADRKLIMKVASRLYKEIQAAREKDAENESPSPYESAAALTKALAPTASRPVQIELTRRVINWFGPSGGQAVQYDRELCARLRFRKAISMEEEGRWRQFGRLPDRVDLKNPTAMPDQDYWAAANRGHGIVGQLPLLAIAHMARKGR